MARRGKTKLGGVDTRAMLAAGKAQEGVVRAEERGGAYYERQEQSAVQGAAAADRAIQYDVEQRGQAKQAEFQQGMAERQQGLREQQFQAELADKGLQRAGTVEQEMEKGAGQPPLMGGPTPDQQRMADQGEKPLEMPTARGGFQGDYEFTEGRKAAVQQRAATDLLKEQTRLMQAKTSYQKALFSQDEESLEAAKTELMKPIRNLNGPIERLIAAAGDDRKLSAINWGDLAQYMDNENVAPEIAAKGVGGVSNIVRFLRNKMTKAGVEYMSRTGLLPEDDLFDPTTLKGQEFTAEMNAQVSVVQKLAVGGAGPRTLAEKLRQLRQLAALKMVRSWEMEAAGGAGGGGEVPGSLNQPPPVEEQPPVHSQQHPGYVPTEQPGGRGQAVRGLSPEERQRAGQVRGVSGPAPGTTRPRDRERELKTQSARDFEKYGLLDT